MKYNTKEQITDLTLETILSKVTEYDIYAHYLGKFKVGGIYNSPFRKDKNPSFGIFVARNGKMLFKDHGSGICGDVIKFVELFTGITNFNDILHRIIKDLNVDNNTELKSTTNYTPKETIIGIVRQPFTTVDITYWQQFGISESTLKKFDVFSISHYLNNGIVKWLYREDNPMYAFKVYGKFKIYRPLAQKNVKWRNNLTEKHIQGWKQLPKSGDLMIITKSLKDVMSLYEMGIPAISPSSESCFIPEKALEDVKSRFKRILLLFDTDDTGRRESAKISLKTGLESIFIEDSFKAKDISDAIKNTSFQDVTLWFYKILNL